MLGARVKKGPREGPFLLASAGLSATGGLI
jgi:hypothetical protein